MKDVEVKDDTVKQDLERKGASQLSGTKQLLILLNRGDAAIDVEDSCTFVQYEYGTTSSGVS